MFNSFFVLVHINLCQWFSVTVIQMMMMMMMLYTFIRLIRAVQADIFVSQRDQLECEKKEKRNSVVKGTFSRMYPYTCAQEENKDSVMLVTSLGL